MAATRRRRWPTATIHGRHHRTSSTAAGRSVTPRRPTTRSARATSPRAPRGATPPRSSRPPTARPGVTRRARRGASRWKATTAPRSAPAGARRAPTADAARSLALVLTLALAGCGGSAAPRADPARPPAVTLTTLTGASPYAACGRGERTVRRGAEAEPYLAASPTDPDRLIATWQQDRLTSAGAVGVAVAASSDGGATWHSQPLPGGAPCGRRG